MNDESDDSTETDAGQARPGQTIADEPAELDDVVAAGDTS